MNIKEIANIEKSFFSFDEAEKTANILLEFEKPEDILDTNCVTKTPVFSDEFMARIESVFELVSSKYKIDLTVRFDDMGGFTDEALNGIFRKNIDLEFKSRFIANRNRNRLALGLIASGIIFLLTMLLVSNLWKDESVWKDIFVYISDIVTTVTFWEAMTILVVEQKEKRSYLKNLKSRFSAIRFERK
ncbi:MAG: hypothetical protein IJU94_06460 [Clostridia bacterium]|nr:hypothetical protein [Clostridia bacterium]